MDKINLETIEFVNIGSPDFDTKKKPINANNLNDMQTNTNNALSQIQDKMAFFDNEETVNDTVIKSNFLGDNSKINANEIAKVDDEKIETLDNLLNTVIADYTFSDSTQSTISFNVDIKPNETVKIEICGGVSERSDIYVRVNDINSGYYQSGFFYLSTNATDGSLGSPTSLFRANKSGFYIAHQLNVDSSILKGELSLNNILNSNRVFYNWFAYSNLEGSQTIGFGDGSLLSNVNSINKITFQSSHPFKSGTTIKIIKRAI